jgi:hypothetical protein
MDRDKGIITHIIGHINDIFNAQKRFGNALSVFLTDRVYFNAVCLKNARLLLVKISEAGSYILKSQICSHKFC